MNLAQSLLAACERTPEAEALTGVSYAELLDRARRIAGGLDLPPGARVATVPGAGRRPSSTATPSATEPSV